MNTVITTNDIFLFFAQGAYFLLIAIFATKLLRQYNVRIKLFTGILLLVWVILNIKDLIIYNTPVNSALERVNWITAFDQLAVPIIGITMFELSHPKSITPFKATLHLLPFTILLTSYIVTLNPALITASIIVATLYSAFIIICTLISLRSIPNSSPEHKALLKITYSFLIAISIWILSCIYPSNTFDIVYYIVSGIAWYIIYHSINKTYPLEEVINNESIDSVAIDSTTTDTLNSHPFSLALNKLFEQDLIFLNPELTLSDLARSIGTNRSYLSEYFNHECNTSFSDYVNNLRLSYAENLMISNRETSIVEIAYASGFNSISTFRRAFVKKFGLTPSQYRNELK